jgi:hypothetical protein
MRIQKGIIMQIHVGIKQIITGAGLVVLFSCTHYIYIYKSQWQKDKIEVDGKISEWKTPLKFYDEKSKLQYTISNNDENLYICIRAAEQLTQRKMFSAGMKIIIDTSEKASKNPIPLPSILFPEGRKEKNKQVSGDLDLDYTSGAYRSMQKPGLSTMQISGFKTPVDGIYPLHIDAGISIGIDTDNNKILTYEAAIPFSTFYKNRLSLSDSTKTITISIILNALAIQGGGMHEGDHGNHRQRGGGGMGGGNGMGSSGNGSMGGGGQMGGAGAGGMGTGGGGTYGNSNSSWVDDGTDGSGQTASPAYSSENNAFTREYLSAKNIIKAEFQLSVK